MATKISKVIFDRHTPPQWFSLNGIIYKLRDSIVINGEDSLQFLGVVSVIKKNGNLTVQWYYVESEMTLSRNERLSVHPNEIFLTNATDEIDIETVQMKAAIYHTKGVALSNKMSIPHEWKILRRKYDPYTFRLHKLDMEKDNLPFIPKLEVKYCFTNGKPEDRPAAKRTPSAKGSSKKRGPVESPSEPTLTSPTRRDLTYSNKRKKSAPLYVSTPNPVHTTPPSLNATSSQKIKPTKLNLDKCEELSNAPPKHEEPSSTATPLRRSRRATKVPQSYSLENSLIIEATMRNTLHLSGLQEDSTSEVESEAGSEKENKENRKNSQKGHQTKPCSDSSVHSTRVEQRSTRVEQRSTRVEQRSTRVEQRSTRVEQRSAKNDNILKSSKSSSSRKPLVKRKPRVPTCVIPYRSDKDTKETCFSAARKALHVSAVPETLPCRDEQFADIFCFLESNLEEGTGGCMYISGVPGTGKTATVRDVLSHLDSDKYDYQAIYINGMKLSDPKQLYAVIYKELEQKKVTPDHGELLLREYFGNKERQSIVLVVDELDLLWTRKQDIMYNLFRWPIRKHSKLVVIAIANTMDLPERMLFNRVSSRLGISRLTFQPYTHEELHEIINSRLESTSSFYPEACMLAARKVAAASGDARRALDVCRHAIEIADSEGSDFVTSSHISKSVTDLYQCTKSKAVINGTLLERMLLKSLLAVFRRQGVEEAVLNEVYETFSSLCKFQAMEALAAYTHDSDSDSDPVATTPAVVSGTAMDNVRNKLCQISSTPIVAPREEIKPYDFVSTSTSVLEYNPTVEQLYTPVLGPANPFKTQQSAAQRNMLSGYVEENTGISDFHFESQRQTFHNKGYAEDPTAYADSTGTRYVGEIERAETEHGRTVFEDTKAKIKKRKREQFGDPSDPDNYRGPWAPFVDEVKFARPSDEQKAILDEWATRKEPTANSKVEDDEKTSLHIEDTHDYQGRSFLVASKDMGVNLYNEEPPAKCFLPKKLLHTWQAHNKGVAKITLFPKTAHILLSAGMDSKIKLWEVYDKRRCIRTYAGHNKAVRDVVFNADGTKFLSASYDRMIKLWDTETGKCISRFTTKKVPYCVQFHPDKQDYFVAGMADKKIISWDINTGDITQEYDRHLGAVNTITFIQRNLSFVSTSDDKSIRVWDWDIPVDTKHIAEPSMHAIPAVALSPTGKWLACQSMDNQISVFATHKLRLNRKKTFKGHMVAGYACQCSFSPEGSYLLSGDADGRCFIWDWKTTRVFKRFKAHDKVCIGAIWHPHETSKVITCGWDGFIKLWD